MAHGERAAYLASNCGREYWSARPGVPQAPHEAYFKRLTHRAERRQAKAEVRKEILTLDPGDMDLF